MKNLVLAALAAVALCLPSGAHAQSGRIEVTEAWARATIGQARNSAAYMQLTNRGPETDRLLGASTQIAGRAELHTTMRDGDVLRMREMDSVELEPGKPVAFAPGGVHIMLLDVEPLKAGRTFTLTLEFEKAGKMDVRVLVQPAVPAHGGGHRH